MQTISFLIQRILKGSFTKDNGNAKKIVTKIRIHAIMTIYDYSALLAFNNYGEARNNWTRRGAAEGNI